MKKIDFDTTVKLQDTIDKSPRLRLSNVVGDVMEGATFFASPEVSVVGVIILTGIALYDRKKKKIRWMALGIPLLFFLLVMAELYGKTVVHHPAPPFFMIKNPTTIFPKYYINDQFSYPSGHTARAVFLSIVLFSMLHTTYEIRNTSDRLRKKKAIIVGCILCGYITLVSVSRIYLGHHWFSDIIGGFFLGSGCAVFAYFLFLHPSSNS
jgi:undecaprenyl-diphosphatase